MENPMIPQTSEQVLAEKLAVDLEKLPSMQNTFTALESVDELIDWLDKWYPERCPTFQQTEKEIWFYAGARELVRSLRLFQEMAAQQIAEQNRSLSAT